MSNRVIRICIDKIILEMVMYKPINKILKLYEICMLLLLLLDQFSSINK